MQTEPLPGAAQPAVVAPSLPPGVAAPGDPRDESSAVNLTDLLTSWALRRPAATALVDATGPRHALTWSELDRRVDEVAAGLAARGLRAGHRLALLGPNSTAFVVAYLAALRGGLVAVPLNPESTARELEQLLADSGARVLLADPRHAETAAAVAAGLGVELLSLSADGLDSLALGDRPVSSPQDPETLAVLLYTAGTSGRPKAAMLTHRALLGHLEHVHRVGLVTSASTVLASLPLFHVFGLNAVLGSWLRAGGRVVLLDGYTDRFCAVLREEKVTNLPLAPPMLARLLADDELDASLSSLETVVSGAAPLPEELAAAFTARTGLAVDQGYGLTEAAPGVTVTFETGRRGPGHVGRPLPGVQVRIGDGRDASEPDEISVRGRNLFSGYWPDGSGGPDEDGWFGTGDIGYLEDGELFLVDRARELVIVSGFNVYPAEVEQVLLQLPGVAATAVVGAPDQRTGEQVVAFVVPADGAEAEQVEQEVADHCARQLARFKRPAVVRVVPELPRGATGKVQKGVLRDRVRSGSGR